MKKRKERSSYRCEVILRFCLSFFLFLLSFFQKEYALQNRPVVRGNRLNAKLNISQVRKDNKEQGIRAVTKAAESLAVRWTEPATPHWGSLGSREIKCSVVAFSPGTSCKLLFIPFFVTESGAEMFRQEIIYVSIFQRHFIV